MDWRGLRFWEYTTADWAGLQFAVLVTAAIVAWRQVVEARHQREELARPFVVMTLEVATTVAEFKIETLGERSRGMFGLPSIRRSRVRGTANPATSPWPRQTS